MLCRHFKLKIHVSNTLSLIYFELAVEFNTLTGVGYQNTPFSNGLKFLSMAGGAPIVISGLNMASMPQMNSIEFSPTFLNGVDLFGPVLSCKYLSAYLFSFRKRRIQIQRDVWKSCLHYTISDDTYEHSVRYLRWRRFAQRSLKTTYIQLEGI